MFSLVMALSLVTGEPQPPKGIPWPGGVWQKDGKDYPTGSFIWIKQADQDAYTKAHAAWEAKNPGKVLAKRATFQWDFMELAGGLRKMDWAHEDGKITGTSPLAAYGGSGSFSATYTKDSRKIEIVLNKADVGKLLRGIDMKTPIEVNGTAGLLTGTIDGDKGSFVGTQMRTSGVSVTRVELTVDFKAGTYVSVADTSFGRQTFRGRLRVAK